MGLKKVMWCLWLLGLFDSCVFLSFSSFMRFALLYKFNCQCNDDNNQHSLSDFNRLSSFMNTNGQYKL